MPRLDPTTIAAVRSFDELLKWLRDALDWPLESETTDDATFEWDGQELRIQEANRPHLKHGRVRQLRPLDKQQPWGIFLVEFTDETIHRTTLRQVLRGLVPNRRRDSALPSWKHENLLFICATSNFERFTFAHFRGEKAAKARLTTFGWRRGSHFLRTLCEYNLPALRWPEDDGADVQAWVSAWAKAFDKEPLTREFFKRFDKTLDVVKADIEYHQKLASAEAYSRSQLLLERLIFIYFLQRRGWLDQKRDWLIEHFQPYRDQPDQFSFYEEILERLFWTLASPPNATWRFPGIPFLNGGLFDDDEFAPTPVRRKQNPPLRIRNSTFAAVFDDFLEAFNFTVREDTPLDQDVAVDPEMLGKVFESIVLHAEAADPDAQAPDKRKATGSYYTPRIVVHFICREALLQWLVSHLSGANWSVRLRQILDIQAADGLDPDELKQLRDLLSPSDGKQLLGLIANLKCCDPAVGSGAFPVGLLQEILNLRRVVEAAANGYVDPVRKDGAEWIRLTKSHIVENCLYGADIQQQAIEICRLRLWLSIVVDYDIGLDPFTADRGQFYDAIQKISQLPNLEMNFRRGDSLLDHISGIPVLVAPQSMRDFHFIFDKIRKLGADLHRAVKAERKKKLRLEILRQRIELSRRVLESEIKILRPQMANLGGSFLAAFGFDETASEAQTRRHLEHEIQQAGEALQKLDADSRDLEKLEVKPMAPEFYAKLRRLEGADFDSPFNFSWRIDFPQILGVASSSTLAGEFAIVNQAQAQQELSVTHAVPVGFDIMVGNPPFVTARNPVKRELYRERWPRVCHGKYLLVCPFFELSFGLLKTGGQLGFIVSNAFAKREFGQPLVADFFPTVDLQKVVDCSGLMFPGHGTPTCIVFGRHAKPDPKSPIRIAAILPGGGDLRTSPEESPLWHTIAEHHDESDYKDGRIVVSDRSRKEMAKFPWTLDSTSSETQFAVEAAGSPLGDFIQDDVGVCTMTNADDIFMFSGDAARRHSLPPKFVPFYFQGEELRDWAGTPLCRILLPYDSECQPIPDKKLGNTERRYLLLFKSVLENRHSFANKTFKELGRIWFEFERHNANKYSSPRFLAFTHIATHSHFVFTDEHFVFGRHTQVVKFPASASGANHHLIASLLNSSTALFWLKQVCFSKRESEEAAADTYYEFSGSKVQQLPVPSAVADALRGKASALSERLTALSQACWERGHSMPSLALKKLFEKEGEAYHAWNSSLPGHVPPHSLIASPFASSAALRETFRSAVAERDRLRAEMIALQEEMDWLVYEAYGLGGKDELGIMKDEGKSEGKNLHHSSFIIHPLSREHRPFCFWKQADEDYDKAVTLIPSDWPPECKNLWQSRLAAIRDNEHIRRIEQPVYKRRWDEQWKVGNRWQCGPVAYAAEFVDAFAWWLAEKAEWHLEHKGSARGSTDASITLETWTAALWKDPRIQTTWPAIAEALNQVAAWKAAEKEAKTQESGVGIQNSASDFGRFFKELVNGETVPDGIPFAVPWNELEKKMKIPAKAKSIRGKLNVPRERFRSTPDGRYFWAGEWE
ncbi:MAG: hypothetical protein HY360_20105 [Verrucomicrobia bacterium]|nr:hypothetical protein [Verrucomicrobiota bacterium]